MYRRKIQLVAGSTYSISLPKAWIIKNKLKEKKELILYEQPDKTLLVSPTNISRQSLTDMTVAVEDHPKNLIQILFAIYYLGVENITVTASDEIPKALRSKIRNAVKRLSGTEITFEDTHKVSIKVLLDQSKIDIGQLLFRISLIVGSSISNLIEGIDIGEIRMNEDEIDRLYHLIAKTISLSLTDTAILHSSNIKNISLVPSLIIINKRLENVGDVIESIADYIHDHKLDIRHKEEILSFISDELDRGTAYLISQKRKGLFEKMTHENRDETIALIEQNESLVLQKMLLDLVQFVIELEEALVNMSFYTHLASDDVL